MKTDNELIADFMGATQCVIYVKSIGNVYGYEFHDDDEDPALFTRCEISDLQYHSSWEWLMPVVEKIESIDGVRFVIEKNKVLVLTHAVQPEYYWNSGTTSQSKLQTTHDE